MAHYLLSIYNAPRHCWLLVCRFERATSYSQCYIRLFSVRDFSSSKEEDGSQDRSLPRLRCQVEELCGPYRRRAPPPRLQNEYGKVFMVLKYSYTINPLLSTHSCSTDCPRWYLQFWIQLRFSVCC